MQSVVETGDAETKILMQDIDDFVNISIHCDNMRVQQTVQEAAPALLNNVNEAVDSLADGFWPVNKQIHDHPELALKEFIAHKALTTYMRAQPGWTVTESAHGIETAWIAEYDSGRPGPVISFNAEYDSLPGIGHACGHNLIATASVVGATAAAKVMKETGTSGKIILFGTPAEEDIGGKIMLLNKGAYSDRKVELNIMAHPGITPNAAMMSTNAIASFKVEYFGRAAHAAANPWLGINALDALVQGYNNFSMLRQQTMPGDIIQGYICDGGVATNIIHEYAAGKFAIRAKTHSRLEELREMVLKCFEAGSLSTGAKMKVTSDMSYKDHVPNRPLAKAYTRYFNALQPPEFGGPIATGEAADRENGVTLASTDQGDISYAMPSLHAGFTIIPGEGGQGPHNAGFAASAGTKDSYERAMRVAKSLAGVALEALRDGAFLAEVKERWREDMKAHKSAVPARNACC